MGILPHLASSALYAGSVYWITGSAEASGAGFLAGVLIDVDHVVEYWHDHGGPDLSVGSFFRFCNSGTNTVFFILFHSFELVLAITALAYVFQFGIIGYAVAGGMFLHLALDYMNILRKFSYRPGAILIFSFVYRFLKGFSREAIDTQLRKTERVRL